MKSDFSRAWKPSKQPRKQRKYAANAPLHLRTKAMTAKLSKELAKKYTRRSIPARNGDKVKVMRGQFRKKTGKIERVDRKKSRVYVTGIETMKKDGSKALYPMHVSNIMITELNTEDKRRTKKSS